ncbi:hypothetical protein ADK57_11020 [Streptomyces sp. MMG1533]|uniref:hypothetical protein n=1 Tax=Streptomyces sp. MMG1533 TaxID=1415546 RepID=UPI0006AE7A39|nr:hypothetical protein [Streptomyces sp. MMG1533]KOU71544.1 hypothetical protein ADK57_11020 [Streptomyces sp. MMG1533]
MGVFARLLRRSKTTEEASTAEAQAGTPTAEPATQEAAEAKGSVETEAGAKSKTKAEAKAEDAVEETAVEAVEDTSGSGEGVEIPKQQSAEEAADSEAGEGART